MAVKAELPSNVEAARFYSEGLQKLRNFEPLAARDLLEKAVAADPRHAMSYAYLASAWKSLGYDQKAVAAAQKPSNSPAACGTRSSCGCRDNTTKLPINGIKPLRPIALCYRNRRTISISA